MGKHVKGRPAGHKPPMPISPQMARLRGPKLTPAQENIIQQFVKTEKVKRKHRKLTDKEKAAREKAKAAQVAYGRGFKAAVDYENAKDRIATSVTKATRKTAEKQLRNAELKITPAPKQATINAKRKFIERVLEDVRKSGAPGDIKELINSARRTGLLNKLLKKGNDTEHSDRTARDILKKQFGLKGKPGRRSGNGHKNH